MKIKLDIHLLRKIVFSLYFSYTPVIAILSLLLRLSGLRTVVTAILGILLFFMLASDKNSKVTDWIFLVALFFLLLCFNFNEYATAEYYQNIIFTKVLSLNGGLFGYLIIRQKGSNDSDFYVALKTSAFINFVYYFYKSFEVILNGVWTSFADLSEIGTSSSMAFGYEMLFPALVFMLFFFIEKKKIYLLFSIVAFAEILLFGGRGPILSYVAFIGLYIIIGYLISERYSLKKLSNVIILFLITILIIIFYTNIISWVNDTINSLGFSSRSLDMLIEGNALDDNGRNNLWESAWRCINEYGAWNGHGVMSEPFYLRFSYCHNILLDMMFELGMFPGIIICLILLIYIIRSIFTVKDKDTLLLLLLFISAGLVKLIYSSSFWYEGKFWMLLGLIVSLREKNIGCRISENMKLTEMPAHRVH